MTREIKFRCWDNDKAYMFYFDMVDATHPNYANREVIPHLLLMQYTGLKDKNGKEIYCGDIVGYHFGSGFNNGEVKWSDLGLCWEIEGITLGYLKTETSLRVKGNIYENPDLIK